MVYRLGRKVKPAVRPVKLVCTGLAGGLLVGALAMSYSVSKTKLATSLSPAQQGDLGRLSPRTLTVMKKPLNATSFSMALAGLRTAACGTVSPRNAKLIASANPQLHKLAEYEQVCGGAFIDRDSFFIPTPANSSQAQTYAQDVARQLKDYAAAGVKPLVFMEPANDSGNLDLKAYQAGAYDTVLDSYFAAIRAQGVTDATMGLWVLLPEGNTPVWSSVDPNVFSSVVTRTATFQKKHFPASQTAIMLDSQTYPSTTGWDDGAYLSLLPYVQNIPKGLIDSFGLQGFPWASPANQNQASVYDPGSYLRVDLAAQAARSLGLNSVWLNTGSFHQMYTQDSHQTVTATPLQRQAMLTGTVAQAKALRADGFSVAIHLFAENKSGTSEAVDWSYWRDPSAADVNTEIFKTFVHDAQTDNIPLWLYDSDQH